MITWSEPAALTALLAVLNPVTLELSRADPLRRPPLERDSSVTDVFHRQPDGLTCRSLERQRADKWPVLVSYSINATISGQITDQLHEPGHEFTNDAKRPPSITALLL